MISKMSPPWPKDFVACHVGGAGSGGLQKVSGEEMPHCLLNASLRKPGSLGQLRMTETRNTIFRCAPQGEINQKGGRLSIMAHQVPHKRVEDVSIQGIALVVHAHASTTAVLAGNFGRERRADQP